jgi:hypothetical protein
MLADRILGNIQPPQKNVQNPTAYELLEEILRANG